MTQVDCLPERVDGPSGVLLRGWVADDAQALDAAVTRSADHLRPWMEWMADEPLTVDQRRTRIEQWKRDRPAGGDTIYGVFVGDAVAGGCGLHRRLGQDGLEIGYWIHVDFIGQGLATTISAMLTDAAFAQPGIERVQIRHDKANVRSSAVPRKLGFALVDEVTDQIEAPAEVGVSWYWQITREQWRERAPLASAVSPRV
jgi:RimJ/RimL family protein N-acetyltransferase